MLFMQPRAGHERALLGADFLSDALDILNPLYDNITVTGVGANKEAEYGYVDVCALSAAGALSLRARPSPLTLTPTPHPHPRQLEYVFTKPYREAAAAATLRDDSDFMSGIESLKAAYRGESSTNLSLCHGDLHAGSVMVDVGPSGGGGAKVVGLCMIALTRLDAAWRGLTRLDAA